MYPGPDLPWIFHSKTLIGYDSDGLAVTTAEPGRALCNDRMSNGSAIIICTVKVQYLYLTCYRGISRKSFYFAAVFCCCCLEMKFCHMILLFMSMTPKDAALRSVRCGRLYLIKNHTTCVQTFILPPASSTVSDKELLNIEF